MNIELLRKVQQAILKEPRQFQMRKWFTVVDAHTNTSPPNCGTACCIGGWASVIALGANPKETKEIRNKQYINFITPRKALGLTPEQAERLFFSYTWPLEFLGEVHYSNFDSLPPDERARLAVARIEHFINTDGKE